MSQLFVIRGVTLIYLEMKEEKLMPTFGLRDVATDMWNNSTVDENLHREICEKGVVVFDRDIERHG